MLHNLNKKIQLEIFFLLFKKIPKRPVAVKIIQYSDTSFIT